MSALRQTRRLWRKTQHLLENHRGEVVLLGAGRILVAVICLCMVLLIRQAAGSGADFAAIIAMLLALAAAAPMRTETVRHLCGLTDVLTADDEGFLNCTSRLWLWRRAAVLRLLCGCLMLCAWLPAILLAMTARVIWLTMPESGEVMLPLLTVLHLLLLIPAALILPLRVAAAATALPYVLLKAPEKSCREQLRLAFRLTHGQTLRVMLTRLCCLPMLMLPVPAVTVLPMLLCTELLRYEKRYRLTADHTI